MRQVSFDIPETEYQKLLSIAESESLKPNTKARLVLLAFLGGSYYLKRENAGNSEVLECCGYETAEDEPNPRECPNCGTIQK